MDKRIEKHQRLLQIFKEEKKQELQKNADIIYKFKD